MGPKTSKPFSYWYILARLVHLSAYLSDTWITVDTTVYVFVTISLVLKVTIVLVTLSFYVVDEDNIKLMPPAISQLDKR